MHPIIHLGGMSKILSLVVILKIRYETEKIFQLNICCHDQKGPVYYGSSAGGTVPTYLAASGPILSAIFADNLQLLSLCKIRKSWHHMNANGIINNFFIMVPSPSIANKPMENSPLCKPVLDTTIMSLCCHYAATGL